MSNVKILKNQSGDTIKIVGVPIQDEGQYTVPSNKWLDLAEYDGLEDLIDSGDIVVNNGEEDLSPDIAKSHVNFGAVKVVHEMDFLTGNGENAPAIEEISNSLIALAVDINDKFYSSAKLTNIIGDTVKFRFYICVNNTEADKWGQAKICYRTSTGMMDKQMNSIDGCITIGPVEVPTTPYIIFPAEITIPTTYFSNGETQLYVGVERETPGTKPSFSGSFYVLKYEVEYWQRLL
jgi:hypothetical protein